VSPNSQSLSHFRYLGNLPLNDISVIRKDGKRVWFIFHLKFNAFGSPSSNPKKAWKELEGRTGQNRRDEKQNLATWFFQKRIVALYQVTPSKLLYLTLYFVIEGLLSREFMPLM
jgi:hypothetical protein